MAQTFNGRTRALSLTLGATILAFCAFCLTTGYSSPNLRPESSNTKATQSYAVHTLHSPGLPVRLKGEIVPAEEEPGNLKLKYTITNLTAHIAEDFEVGIYLLTKKGRIRAGQVWRLPVEVSGQSNGSFAMLLTNKPGPDDYVVVAMQEVSQDQRTWHVNAIPFLQSAKIAVTSDALAIASITGPKGSVTVFASAAARLVAYRDGCGSNFCEAQSSAANAACSVGCSCGVNSFNCNQTNCTSSFTCFQCNSCLN